jgi:D-alanyl-D-alanine carboxypeptidase (penicillin-binding protein 5/6)
MSTWVVLQKLPLATNQLGPCLSVNAHDVAFYHQNLSIQESTVKIVRGERLCEETLLRGLFVHSAGDYVELLVRLTGLSSATFVAAMNADASSLGLTQTHFADFTGISPHDLSTAHDVTALTVDLMTNQPVLEKIVALTRVHLPFAGWVASYTPYIGTDGVVGVKSGYTLAAGGCVAMEINVSLGGIIVPTYEVILDQQGPNALNVAGAHAVTLMRALRTKLTVANGPSGKFVKWTGSSNLVTPTTTTTSTSTTTSTTTTTLPPI